MIEVIVSVCTMYLPMYMINYEERHKVNWLINIFITAGLCYGISLFDKRFTVLVFLVISIILLRKSFISIKKTVVIVITATIINIFAGYISTVIYHKILDSVDNISSNIALWIGYLIIFILVVAISKFVTIITNVQSVDFNKKNIYLVVSMSISSLFIIFIIFNVIFNSYRENDKWTNIYSMLIVIISLAIMFMIYMAIRSDIKSKELDMKNIELINLQNYIEVTENQYNEIRKFKHDYINIISTIAGYIEDEDICSLKNHFENNIVPLTKSFENESVKLNILEKVKVMELKGLLKIKLAQAISKNIKISVEVIEKIEKINWDVVNLCRVVGILLDNSIEAAEIIEDGFVNIAIFKKENEVYIVIQNSFNGENISIQQIYKRGFSTKGKNRGLGLSTVKELLSNNKDVSSETIIDENIFIQLLKINNE